MSGLGASKSDLADARSSSLAAQLGQSQPKPQHVREYERLEANKMRAAMAEADREAWLRMSYEENDEYAAYLVAESGDYANGGAGKMGPALWRSERQRRERENEEEVSPWLTRGRELYNQRSAARNGRNKAMALGSKLRLEIAQLESARKRPATMEAHQRAEKRSRTLARHLKTVEGLLSKSDETMAAAVHNELADIARDVGHI